MDRETASSYLNDPKIAILTCPHTKNEASARVRAVEKAANEGTLRVLYVRVPDFNADRVPLFDKAFPTCTVKVVRYLAGKYTLVKLTPHGVTNEDLPAA